MPLALLVIGVVFLTAAIRGKQKELYSVLKDDFTGSNNFLVWGFALFLIGAVGYYRPLKPIANTFMVLVFFVLFLSNRGFLAKFTEQLRD